MRRARHCWRAFIGCWVLTAFSSWGRASNRPILRFGPRLLPEALATSGRGCRVEYRGQGSGFGNYCAAKRDVLLVFAGSGGAANKGVRREEKEPVKPCESHRALQST